MFSFSGTPTNLLLGQYIIIYPIKYPQSISIIVIVFQSFSRKRRFWDAETHDSQSQFFRWFMKWGRLFFFLRRPDASRKQHEDTLWFKSFCNQSPSLYDLLYIYIYNICTPLLCRFMLFPRVIFWGSVLQPLFFRYQPHTRVGSWVHSGNQTWKKKIYIL